MVTDPLQPRSALRRTFATSVILGVVLSLSATAGLASAAAEQQGAKILQSVQAGKQKCQQLSLGELEAIGEYAMGRMVGSPASHEAMDRQIRTMRGASGEAQAHVFMGRRFAGCANGAAPPAFGSMMGMMGNYAGTNGGMTGNAGMTGSGRDADAGYGPGMMGDSGSRAGGDGGWNTANIVLAVLMGILLFVTVAGLVAWRPWRRASPKTPFDLLSDRYARGEINSDDYELRRQALSGLT